MATGSNESEQGASRPPRRLGRYTLLKRIAKGGMGEVLLAATSGIEGAERPVIVKMIREEHRTDASFRARFLDEARVQAQLSHSGVASILDATTDDATGEPYVVVEHVDGRNLGDVRARALATGTRVDWAESVAVAQLVAESLAHVHDRRDPMGQPLAIVHRDLSPQNVMVAFTGEVKLIDFGTARGQNRRCHTVAGVVFAKPGYVAPEVANGDSGDFRVDLYALGVMLWELCASRRFLEGDASDHLAAVAAGKRDLPPIAEAVGAPAELDAAIGKLTAHDREDRYGSARDAARDLAALLASALPVPGGERGVRPRVAALLSRLFPGETARFRRDFARLVDAARRDAAAVAAAATTVRPPGPRKPSGSEAVQADTPVDAPIDLSLPEEAAAPAPEPAADPVDASLLPGTRWRLVRAIGRGATSVVWEAEHADVGRRAALKVHAGGEGGRSRFRIEARALTRVEGPFVARLKEAGVASDGRPFTVTELLEGQTLDAWVKERSPLAPADVLEVARKLLVSIEGLHATGLIHRDLKPQNVFCCAADGTVRLLDLGIARDLGEALEEDPPSGGALALHGTPAYMAPEQASGVADERSDVYAVGCILYEMLAGSLPFESMDPRGADGDVVGVLEAKAKGSPEPLAERAFDRAIPEEIDALVMRALARHPSVRFPTAKAMREAIEDVERAPQRKRARRRRLGFGALAAAMAVGAALLAMPMFPETAGLLARAKGVWSAPAAPAHVVEAPKVGLDALLEEPPQDDGGDVLDLLPPEIAAEERALRALEDAGDIERDGDADAERDALARADADDEDVVAEVEPPKPQKKKRRAQRASAERERQGDKKAKPRGKRDAKSDEGAKGDKKPKPKSKSDDKPRKKKKGKSKSAGADG